MPVNYKSAQQRIGQVEIKNYGDVFNPVSKVLDKMAELDNRKKEIADARRFQTERENIKLYNDKEAATLQYERLKQTNKDNQAFDKEFLGLKTQERLKVIDKELDNSKVLEDTKNKHALALEELRGRNQRRTQRLRNTGLRIGKSYSGTSGASATSGGIDLGILSTRMVTDSTNPILAKQKAEDIVNSTPKGLELKTQLDKSGQNLAKMYNGLPSTIKKRLQDGTPLETIRKEIANKYNNKSSSLLDSVRGEWGKSDRKLKDLHKTLDNYSRAITGNIRLSNKLTKYIDNSAPAPTGKYRKKESIDIGGTQQRVSSYIDIAAKTKDPQIALDAKLEADRLQRSLNYYLKSKLKAGNIEATASAKALANKAKTDEEVRKALAIEEGKLKLKDKYKK